MNLSTVERMPGEALLVLEMIASAKQGIERLVQAESSARRSTIRAEVGNLSDLITFLFAKEDGMTDLLHSLSIPPAPYLRAARALLAKVGERKIADLLEEENPRKPPQKRPPLPVHRIQSDFFDQLDAVREEVAHV